MKNYMPNVMLVEKEKELFLEILEDGKDKTFLEWGTGFSTIEIAKKVKKVISIEYQMEWFLKIKHILDTEKITNAEIVYVPVSAGLSRDGEGNLAECFDYVNYPKQLNEKYDIIFIDGRARVECAKVAINLLKENGIIVIHDYPVTPLSERQHYREVEKFLKPIEFVNMLRVFVPYKEDEVIPEIIILPDNPRVMESIPTPQSYIDSLPDDEVSIGERRKRRKLRAQGIKI